jgi:flagellar biosynthesis/type III secretory pathway protein FliH
MTETPARRFSRALAAALAPELLTATALLQADQDALEAMRQHGYEPGYQDGTEVGRMTA